MTRHVINLCICPRSYYHDDTFLINESSSCQFSGETLLIIGSSAKRDKEQLVFDNFEKEQNGQGT